MQSKLIVLKCVSDVPLSLESKNKYGWLALDVEPEYPDDKQKGEYTWEARLWERELRYDVVSKIISWEKGNS